MVVVVILAMAMVYGLVVVLVVPLLKNISFVENLIRSRNNLRVAWVTSVISAIGQTIYNAAVIGSVLSNSVG